MHALQTAILQHTTAHGTHHDWLIEDPRLPDPHHPAARLWTARVSPPPADWQALGRFDLQVLPPHRRAYLTYQGPVTNNRGWVRRVAHGRCFVELWTPARIILRPDLPIGCERIELRQHTDHHWLAITQ